MIASFRDLIMWQKAFDLVVDIYNLTEKLPKNEIYGLSSQIQRCAISIPSNIAEGQQRNNRKEFRQFLGIAKGSSAELETQLLLVEKLYNIDTGEIVNKLQEIQKMLQSVLNKLSTLHSQLSTGVK
jgi:four helix bundle protein